MKTIKDYVCFKKGTWNKNIYTENALINAKLPSKCPINIEFDDKRRIGYAENFRYEHNKGIICDITITKITKLQGRGIVPLLIGRQFPNKEIKDITLKLLSLVKCPAFEYCCEYFCSKPLESKIKQKKEYHAKER